jgi:iron complex outermembrane receptor protein
MAWKRCASLIAVSGVLAIEAGDAAYAQVLPSEQAQGQSYPSDIIVTAQKRSQNVQDVPIAIDVLGAEQLEEMRITRPQDLQTATPGLLIQQFNGANIKVSIRGVGSDSISGTQSSDSVAAHIDGFYLGFAAAAMARLFDLDRVEVLKGPQGTLYGRNASGGVINTITRAPGDTFGGNAEFSYGSFNTVRWNAAVDLPIAEGAGIRFSTAGASGDGFIDNVVDDRKFGEEEWRAVRARGAFDLTESLRLDLLAMYIKDDGTQILPVLIPGQIGAAAVPDFYSTRVNRPVQAFTKDVVVAATLTYDINDQLSAKSITGYMDHSDYVDVDNSLLETVFPGTRFELGYDYKQFSQELQFLYNSDNINAIVGAVYVWNEGFENRYTSFGNFAVSPDIRFTQFRQRRDSSDAYAIFGDVTVSVTDRFKLIGGLRYNIEEKDAQFSDTAINALGSGKQKFKNLTGRFVAQFEPTPDQLIYASVSRGFKAGIIGLGQTLDQIAEINDVRPETIWAYELGAKGSYFDRRLTVNLAAFYYDYRNLHVVFNSGDFLSSPPRIGFSFGNAPKATIYGLDASVQVRPVDGLTFTANANWLPRARYDDYVQSPINDFSGNRIVRSPKLSALFAIDYRFAVGPLGDIITRAEMTHRSATFYNPNNRIEPFSLADGTVNPNRFQNQRLGSLDLFNATVRYEHDGGRWALFVRGRNITGEKYITYPVTPAYPGLPREVDVGVSFRF